MSDKFSQADLEVAHSELREIMRMGTLDGPIKLVSRIDKKGSLGQCKPNFARCTYKIKVLDPALVPPDVENDVIDTIAHELAHAKFWWLTKKKLSKIEDEHHEFMINEHAALAAEVYRLRRKGRKK